MHLLYIHPYPSACPQGLVRRLVDNTGSGDAINVRSGTE